MLFRPFLIFAACCFAAAGCTPGEKSAAANSAAKSRASAEQVRVLESFNVGEGVYVRSLEVDTRRSRLWVGTSVGVHEIDLKTREPLNTFTREHGLANEYIFAIMTDAAGYTWFGTNGGGVSRYRDGEWKTYFPMHGLADYWVYSFAQGKDGNVWIGTWAGANKVAPQTGHFTTYVKELVNEWVYGLGVDERGRVWFGTEGGVSMFDGSRWQSWTHKEGLGAPNSENLPLSLNTGLGTRSRHDLSVLTEGEPTYNPNYVFSLAVAKDQSVWAGTWGGGVSRYDGRRWTNLTSKDGLAGNIVFSLAQAPDGVWWFGTNHGVSRYDGKTWRNFTRADGLIDDNVYAIAVAPDGEVWVGTRGGVARIGAAPAPGKEAR